MLFFSLLLPKSFILLKYILKICPLGNYTFNTIETPRISVILEGDEVVMVNGENIRDTDILIEDIMQIFECMIYRFYCFSINISILNVEWCK